MTGLLEVEGLTRRYGSLVALDGVSLSVAAGARHAVIGPNGAGKSTLFALVTGSLRPSAGRITFDGQDVTRRPDHARARAGMGKTFQHSSLFTSLPVLDNVALATQRAAGLGMAMLRPAGRHAAVREQAMRQLDLVGLGGRAAAPAAALSHGERRQLEVAERYLAAQGQCLGRAGRVSIERDGDGKVWVGGDAVTCIDGQVTL